MSETNRAHGVSRLPLLTTSSTCSKRAMDRGRRSATAVRSRPAAVRGSAPGGVATRTGWLLLSALALAAGCGAGDRVVAYLSGPAAGGATADGGGVLGTFSAPVAIYGLLDATDVLQDPSLSTDELELYFASNKGGTLDIWRSTRATTADAWGTASLVEELSSDVYDDQEPELTRDDLTMYFASNRPGAEAGTHIWVSRRSGRAEPWGAPAQLQLTGTAMMARGPTIDAPQLEMIFYSDGAEGDYDLYRMWRPSIAEPWQPPAPLSEINSTVFDWDPGLFQDGCGLVFGSRRGGTGKSPTSDLFETVAASDDGTFTAPHPLDALNTKASEGDPWLSNDGHHIVFSSDRGGTVSRLYESWR